jgi:molecular chaperone GrpE
VNDQATPGEETPDDLTVPELDAIDAEFVELLEATPEPEQEVEVIPVPVIDFPDDPAEAVPVLLAALGVAQAEAATSLDALQRVAAEFDNFRKRAARDRNEIVERASQRLIERMLPALDGFDAALMYDPQTEAEEKLLAGMRDTHRLLMDTLEADGFEPIEASGVPFDPAVHEAVTGPTGDGEGELVVREMRRGYTLRGRVIRAALVAVEHA